MMQFFKMWVLTTTAVGMFAAQLMLVRAENSPSVTEGAVVVIEYTITVPESRIVIPNNVSQFVSGHHDLLPNLEKALTGMKKGDETRVDLTSDQAFGPYDESKKGIISKDHLPADTQPGTVLTTEEGVPFVVVDLSGPLAAVDFNHPLAGKHLVIDVKILDIEWPGSEERAKLNDIEREFVI
jgi:FKBP-type peptidyl-prolyl cis-trans isomerase 2